MVLTHNEITAKKTQKPTQINDLKKKDDHGGFVYFGFFLVK